ncbi:MAG: formylglycine-generating enzyme family protein [Burkholderiales bacterium]|nr:formylglycine-generating enzyme family protein [Burkholderiales bacterium]
MAASAVAAGEALTDCTDCPQMVVVPGGRFVMGAAPGEEAREGLAASFAGRSEPLREVRVKPFAAGKFEVTRGEYRRFVEATGRAGRGCFVWARAQFELDPNRSWLDPGYAQDDSHPATCVSWEDARAYAHWLGLQTGRPYRLLTEAEWEYAARAGTLTSRHWGDDPNAICNHVNGADASTLANLAEATDWHLARCNDRYPYTAPAGSFAPNGFGLHDMLGNAGEWTEDCWNGDYHGAPVDGRAWTGGDCALRVVRGGGWNEGPLGLRAAYRVGSPTTIRLYSRGFRIARDL